MEDEDATDADLDFGAAQAAAAVAAAPAGVGAAAAAGGAGAQILDPSAATKAMSKSKGRLQKAVRNSLSWELVTTTIVAHAARCHRFSRFTAD